MLDLNDMRTEFGKYLNEHTHTRWGLDAALMHVCQLAYKQGMQDGALELRVDEKVARLASGYAEGTQTFIDALKAEPR